MPFNIETDCSWGSSLPNPCTNHPVYINLASKLRFCEAHKAEAERGQWKLERLHVNTCSRSVCRNENCMCECSCPQKPFLGPSANIVTEILTKEQETLTCTCCKKSLSFFGKYTVDNAQRRCMFCTDICYKGGYGKCVQQVYKRAQDVARIKDKYNPDAGFYRPETVPTYHPAALICQKEYHEGNDIYLTPYGIKIKTNPNLPKGEVRIVDNNGNKVVIQKANSGRKK